ncbi:adenylate/guanylate cyclase domain-containing protein [Microvirga yunnanensis]|uniref:adenylate/guanylate cyclase domain-containing protein n=1 Tax=Microvirga yunnanensis TaxID=2953740 RepID=UPI0021C93B27|nr:adenylate/guanylate cyclase domain-containing protein [Microvirga sp. HBU65207]
MDRQEHKVERRLVAIFAADVAGYSRLMSRDEAGTLRSLTARREIMDRLISEHGGRIANTAGDSVLAEFPSAVDAVQCAVAVQEAIAQMAQDTPKDRHLQFRIGVHVGDVMVRGGDLLGDGVNVAARLESHAEPGSVYISDATYPYVRRSPTLGFDDLGPQEMKNIDGPVRVYRVTTSPSPVSGSTPAAASAKALPLPDKPSIAVLPFTNMSGDPDQDYLADGIVEEILAALSRVRSFFVISRSSTFTYKGKAVDPRQVGRELGVRYILEGSIRRSGQRLRIMAQLIDAAAGIHVWSDRYDGEVSDIFDLQDRVTEAVVGAVEPRITLSEIERAKRKRPDNLDAYDYVMRAFPALWSQEPDEITEGLRFAREAIRLDPTYALPKALAAWGHAQDVVYTRTATPDEDREKAFRLAQEAASLDNNDPLILTALATAYSLLGQFDLGLSAVEKALALDPNSAWAWSRSGYLNVYKSRPERAIEHFERAIRLSPLDPMHYNTLFGIAGAHFVRADYEEAVRWIEKGLAEKPSAVWVYRFLTAAYANAGRIEDARRAASKLCAAYPSITISQIIQVVPALGKLPAYADGLRKAGLPE